MVTAWDKEAHPRTMAIVCLGSVVKLAERWRSKYDHRRIFVGVFVSPVYATHAHSVQSRGNHPEGSALLTTSHMYHSVHSRSKFEF